MKAVQFSAQMMQSLAYLGKGLLSNPQINLPKLTSMGEEIKSVDELADVMGVDRKIAAVYAIQGDSGLKSEAVEVLAPGIYNAFEDGYEAITHYAYEIAKKTIVEEKVIRMVRDGNGSKYFGLPVGSIIVSDGQKPLDAIAAVANDVPGYNKVVDKQGRSYYIGKEQNRWVVRSGASKEIVYQTANNDGEQESLYWLNGQLGGSTTRQKSDGNVEIKRQFTTLAVQKLGVQGHAFRNKNGDYSYPVSTVADLDNAIRAFGRAASEDQTRLKAYLKKRARQLKRPDMIPDNWKTGEPVDIEEKDWNLKPGKNWVENTNPGLPDYIERIAKAIFRSGGKTRSQCIAIAVSRVKVWATGKGVDADTQAKAAKAVAQWEKLKASNKVRVAGKKAKS